MVSHYVYQSISVIIDFDAARPIDNRLERVPLYNLSDYRTTHCIQNPCCFCACPGSTGARDVIESAIYIAATGPYRGFWVAGCAQNVSCGYFGNYP
jgi:hypothetical protein